MHLNYHINLDKYINKYKRLTNFLKEHQDFKSKTENSFKGPPVAAALLHPMV